MVLKKLIKVVIKIPKFEMLFYEDKEASFVTMSGQD
jgi:hypothetical protein